MAFEPSPELLRAALQGERSAVRAMVAGLTPVIQVRITRTLFRYRGIGGDRSIRQEVDDFAQNVFLALFAAGALERWSPERGLSLQGFVGLLAEREVISRLRRRRSSPWPDEPTSSDVIDSGPAATEGPEHLSISRETLLQLDTLARARLSEQGFAMFMLLLVEDRDTEEVCAMTGLGRDAVYAWRSRLVRLARELSDELLSDGGAPRRKPARGPA